MAATKMLLLLLLLLLQVMLKLELKLKLELLLLLLPLEFQLLLLEPELKLQPLQLLLLVKNDRFVRVRGGVQLRFELPTLHRCRLHNRRGVLPVQYCHWPLDGTSDRRYLRHRSDLDWVGCHRRLWDAGSETDRIG
jgi:hypothetical protein